MLVRFDMKKMYYLFFVLNVACITTNFEPPDIVCQEVALEPTTTLKQARFSVRYGGYTFRNDEVIAAYVISSDEFGNQYKRLVLQDNFKNPSAGISLLVDKKYLYTKYPIGQKIYIKLKGLTVNYEGKDVVLGKVYGSRTEGIANLELDTYIVRSCEKSKMIPQNFSFENINNFSKAPMQTLVSVENIQFEKTSLGKTYAGKKLTRHTLNVLDENCAVKNTIFIETSNYASFAGSPVPKEKGTIIGILSQKTEKVKDLKITYLILTIRGLKDFQPKEKNCL